MDNLSIKLTADTTEFNQKLNQVKSSLSSLNTQAKDVQKSTNNIGKNISAKINTSQYTQTTQAVKTLIPVFGRISTQIDKMRSAFNLLSIDMGVSVFRRIKLGVDAFSNALTKAGGSFTYFTNAYSKLANGGFNKVTTNIHKANIVFNTLSAQMSRMSTAFNKMGKSALGSTANLGSLGLTGLSKVTSGIAGLATGLNSLLSIGASKIDSFIGKMISLKAVIAEKWEFSSWSSDLFKESNRLKRRLSDLQKALDENEAKIAKKKKKLAEAMKTPLGKNSETDWQILNAGTTAKEIEDLEKKSASLKEQMSGLSDTLSKVPKGFKMLGNEILTVAKHLGILLTKFASLSIVLTSLLLIVKSFKWTNEISKVNDEINDNAEKVNMTAEQYQKWSWIMKIAGSDASALKGHINQLNQRLKGADQDSAKATKGFERLGISVYDANGEFRDSTELFEEAVTRLQKVENTTTRAAIATQIFGRNASELNGLLNMSAQEVEKITRVNNVLGLTASQSAIKLAGAYNDAKDVLAAVGNAMKSTISEIVLPWLIKLIKGIILAITYINIFVRTIFGLKDTKATEKQQKTMNNYGNSVKETTNKVKELKRQLMGFDELNVLQKDDSTDQSSAFDNDFDTNVDTDVGDTLSMFSDDELDRIDAFRKKIEELQGTLQVVTTIALILAGLFLVIFAFFGGGLVSLIAGITLIGLGIAVGNAEGEDGESAFDKISNAISGFAERIKENALAIAAILVGIFLIIKGIMWSSTIAVIAGCSLVALGVLGLKNDDGETVFDQIANKMGMSSEQLKTLAVNIALIIAGLFFVIKGLMGWGVPAIVLGAGLIGLGILTMQDSDGVTVFEQIMEKLNNFIMQFQGVITGLSVFFGLVAVLFGFFTGNIPVLIGGAALIGIGILTGLKEDDNGQSLFDKLIEQGQKFIIDHQALIAGLSIFFGLIALIVGIISFNPALIVGGAALIGAGVFAGMQVDENGQSLFDKIGEKAKSAFDNIVNWWNENVAPIFTLEFWQEKFQSIIEAWGDALGQLWEKVTDFAGRVIDKIKDMCQNIAEKIKNLFSSQKDEAEKELKETQRQLKQSQQQLNKQNKTGNNAQMATRRLQQSTRMMANLQVPKLASGGVATKPTLVQIGEYSSAKSNPEIVSPQSLMAETMQSANMEVVNAIYAIGNQISKTVEEKDTDVYMDGDKMTRKITKKQKEQSKYSSPSLVIV